MRNKILLAGSILLTPTLLLAKWGGPCWNDGYGFGRHYGFGGGIFMLIITIILAAFLIFAGIKLFKINTGSILSKENPMEMLKSRLAKRDITKEEFKELKDEIQ